MNSQMKLSTGIDLIEVERIQSAIQAYGERFLNRIYTRRELDEVGDNPLSLAARFAAKEAVAKALGVGIGLVSWQDIEIQRGPAGEPFLHLCGTAARLAEQQGLTSWSISLSHTHAHAVAVAVAFGG